MITPRRFALVAFISSLLVLLAKDGMTQWLFPNDGLAPSCMFLGSRVVGGPFTTVTLTITEVKQYDDSHFDGLDPFGDFYAVVTIDGSPHRTDTIERELGFGVGLIIDPDGGIHRIRPNWEVSQNVPLKLGEPTPVRIKIVLWDSDEGFLEGDDDQADINPGRDRDLDLIFDPNTGQWSGDVNWPQQCSRGTGGSDVAEVCFDIRSSPDSDGDGLLDFWEECGFDLDGVPPIDLDFPALRADPRYKDMADPQHKDLFVELDWVRDHEPRQATIQALKAAFAVAPIDAGTNASALPHGINAKPNPDGKPGIRLWVDTGNLTDAGGRLVGDNLGDGNEIDPASALDLCGGPEGEAAQKAFLRVKADNFNSARHGFFRYAISAPGMIPSTGEIGGDDFLICGGAAGSLGAAIDQPGTLTHELGHTLNLRHGGNEEANCKPNYLSVMNYTYQLGIPQALSRSPIFELSSVHTIIDYSPPRFGMEGGAGPGSCEDGIDNDGNRLIDADDPACLQRGIAPLPTLKENALDEATVLDPSDPVNLFVFTNAQGKRVNWPVNGDRDGDGKPDGIDWNVNTRPPLAEDGVGVFKVSGVPVALQPGTCVDGIDNMGDGLTDFADPDCQYDTMLPPINIDTSNAIAKCKNTVTNSQLTGFDDWHHISLPFRQFAKAQAGVFEPIPDEASLEELLQDKQEQNTTDLAITKSADADPVMAGGDLTYRLTVTNKGPNPAGRVVVVDTLPEGVLYQSDTAECVEVPEDGTLNCELGALLPGEQRNMNITVSTSGLPVTRARSHCRHPGCRRPSGPSVATFLTNTATVENVEELAGPDPDPSDNTAVATTTLVDRLDRLTVITAEFSTRQLPESVVVDHTPVDEGPAGTLSYLQEFCNISRQQLTSLKSVTTVLTESNVLINRNRGTPEGVGSELSFPANHGYADLRLDSGECVEVPYEIGLATGVPFQIIVDVVGIVSGPERASSHGSQRGSKP